MIHLGFFLLWFSCSLIAMNDSNNFQPVHHFPSLLTDFDRSFPQYKEFESEFKEIEHVYFYHCPLQEDAHLFINTLWHLNEKDYPPAQYILAMIHLYGWHDIHPDRERAMHFFAKAASFGHPAAQCELGKLLIQESARPRFSQRRTYEWLPAIHYESMINQYSPSYDGMLIRERKPQQKNAQSELVDGYQNLVKSSLMQSEVDQVNNKNGIPRSNQSHTDEDFQKIKKASNRKTVIWYDIADLLQQDPQNAATAFHAKIMQHPIEEELLKHVIKSGLYKDFTQLAKEGNCLACYMSGLFWYQLYQSNLPADILKKINEKYILAIDSQLTKEYCSRQAIQWFLKAIRVGQFDSIAFVINLLDEPLSQDDLHEVFIFLTNAYINPQLSQQQSEILSCFFLNSIEKYRDTCAHITLPLIVEAVLENEHYATLRTFLYTASNVLEKNIIDDLLASPGFKKLEDYVDRCGSFPEKYLWGCLLRNSQRRDEGYLCIAQAADDYLPATWKKIEILLESGDRENEKLAIELARKTKNCSSCDDVNYLSENIQRAVAGFQRCAERSKECAEFLKEMYEKGIEGYLCPNYKKMLFYQEMCNREIKKSKQVKASNNVSALDEIKNNGGIKSHNDIEKIFVTIKTYDEFKNGCTNEIIKNINDIIECPHANLDDLYQCVQLLLPTYKNLAFKAFHQAEKILWQEYTLESIDMHDTRLQMMFENNLFNNLSRTTGNDAQAAYTFACALALRCRFQICVPGCSMNESFIAVLKFLKIATKYGKGESFIQSCSNLYDSTLFSIGSFLSGEGNFQEAARYLKPSIKRNYPASMALYAELCLTRKIVINGINSWDYGIRLIEKVLKNQIENQDGHVFKFAKETLYRSYKAKMETIKGREELLSLREQFLSIADYCGKYKENIVSELMSCDAYYTCEELIALNKNLVEEGDLKTIEKIITACNRVGDYELSAEYLKKATAFGSIRAHFDIAELLYSKKIQGNAAQIVTHIHAFLNSAFINEEVFQKNYTHIFKVLSFLIDDHALQKNIEANYLTGYYFLKSYLFSKNDVFLETAIRMIQLGEDYVINKLSMGKEHKGAFNNTYEQKKKFIFAIGISNLVNDIVWSSNNHKLTLFWGNVHYNRYKSEKSFLQERDEHLFHAIRCFERAKELHCKKASKSLSTIYYHVAATIDDPKEALNHINLSLSNDAHNVLALYQRAKLHIEFPHEFQKSIKQATKNAIKDLEKAGNLNYEKAFLYLASIYIIGVADKDGTIKKDKNKGIKLLENLIQEKESIESKILLSKWYVHGVYLPENLNKAEEYLRSVIDVNPEHYHALSLLGQCICKKAMKVTDIQKKEKLFGVAVQFLNRVAPDDRNYNSAILFLTKIYLTRPHPQFEMAYETFQQFLKILQNLNAEDAFVLNELVGQLQIVEDFQAHKCCMVDLSLGIYALHMGVASSDDNMLKLATVLFKKIISGDLDYPDKNIEKYSILARAYLATTYASLLHEQADNLDEKQLKNDICTTALALIDALKVGCENKKFKYEQIEESLKQVQKAFVEILLLRPECASIIEGWFKQIIAIYPIKHLIENIATLQELM